MLVLEDNYADALVAQPVAEIVQKHADVFRKKRAQVAMRAESQHLFQMVGRMPERFGRDFKHQTSVLDEECERELEREEEEEEEQERQVAATNPRQHTAWSYSALLQASSAAELSRLLSSAQSLLASHKFDAQKIASFLRAHVRTRVDKRGRDRLAHISWPGHVFCTQNFMKTVALDDESTNAASLDFFALNEYLRLAEVRAPADVPAPKHCCPNIVNLLLDLLQCHVASQACAVFVRVRYILRGNYAHERLRLRECIQDMAVSTHMQNQQVHAYTQDHGGMGWHLC
jgi:hypothetical protein